MAVRKQEKVSWDDIPWPEMSIEEIKLKTRYASEKLIPQIINRLKDDKRKGVQKLIDRMEKELVAKEQERMRLRQLGEKEAQLRKVGYTFIGGVDEAGRGPLAGPVVAACVILPENIFLPGLNDSKKLTPQRRVELEGKIKGEATAWAVGLVNHKEIDCINIYQATKLAMLKAVRRLSVKPDYLLIDAMTIASDISQEKIIHGDSLCASIAAASIIAKTYRDRIMEILDGFYPYYGFIENKGYGTARHLEALKTYGSSPVHRKSFLHNL
jgi:ribonuclease HII